MVDIPYNPSIPRIEQAKIQARVLIPVVKAMQAELGEERAKEVVRNAPQHDESSMIVPKVIE